VKRGPALDAPNSAVRFSERADEHRPERPVILVDDQQTLVPGRIEQFRLEVTLA
jgi:hypothetical protein